jgi:hypothetical protein
VNSLRWAVPRLKGLLKDDVADGRLTVRVCSPKCRARRGTASKVFKVKTQLAAFSKDGQSFGGFALLFMTLLAGGLASLLMNFTLPIQARRLRVKDRLAETDRKIDSLSTDLDSRIRVPLGVERRRLAVRLGRLTWFTAFGQGMSDVEQGLDRLAKRLDMLEQLQRTLAGYWKARAINIPPTDIEQIEITKKQVVDILQKSEPADADFQAALGLIQQIDKSVVMSAQADVEFARRLVEDLARRKGELAANTGPLTYLWVPDFQLLSEALKSDLIRAPDDVKGILASDYIPLDRLLFRLRLLEAYQRVLKGPQVPPPAWDFWSTELLAELRDSSWESLKRAQRMIRQMEEGLFPEDVIAEVQNGRAEVIVDRVLVSQFESTDLRLRFRRRDVQSAAAREEFTYVWDFGHDFLRERGWTVSHFFPEATEPSPQPLRDAWRTLRRWSREPAGLPTPGASPLPPTGSNPSHPAPGTNTPPGGEGSLAPRAPYDLTVTLIREWNGEEVPDKIRCKIHVLPPPPVRSRVFQAELFRLLLALGLAVLGLVAGAKDQILKLDVLPALVAVFLIGFGADQIKNLVTQRPQP